MCICVPLGNIHSLVYIQTSHIFALSRPMGHVMDDVTKPLPVKAVYKLHLQCSKEKVPTDNLRTQKLCCVSSSEYKDTYIIHNSHKVYLFAAANL